MTDRKLMLGQQFSVEGEYTIKVYNSDGSLKRQVGPFKNLVTNQGLNSLGILSGPTSFNLSRIFVGTGTTPPAVTDTAMANFRAASSSSIENTSVNGGAPDYYVEFRTLKRFNPGVATGNLTEVGVGEWATGALPITCLFSRALIVDSGGNPVTLTILPDEYLDVIYALRYYPSNSDSVATVTDTGTGIVHTCTSRRYLATGGIAASSGNIYPAGNGGGAAILARSVAGVAPSLGAITSSGVVGAYTVSNSMDIAIAAYSNSSYYRDATVSIGLDLGNASTGIEGLLLTSNGAVSLNTQVLISPAIMKTNKKTLSMGFRVSWARRP